MTFSYCLEKLIRSSVNRQLGYTTWLRFRENFSIRGTDIILLEKLRLENLKKKVKQSCYIRCKLRPPTESCLDANHTSRKEMSVAPCIYEKYIKTCKTECTKSARFARGMYRKTKTCVRCSAREFDKLNVEHKKKEEMKKTLQ